MATKPGTLSHAKGFVVNKLYEQRRYGGSHVPVAFLSQGYPPTLRHLIGDAVDKLRVEGVIRIEVKRTGRDSSPHATLAKNGLARARGLLNAYRKSVDLPTLGQDLRTLLPARS